MMKFLNSFLLALHEKEIVSCVKVQHQQIMAMEEKSIDNDFLKYMLKRLETDLEFFEMVQLKAENDEVKSFFGRIVICESMKKSL